MIRRIVFDTSTVVSALLFPKGRLAWLRSHWQTDECTPLASRDTIGELSRVLYYPKFRLESQDVHELLSDYLPYCEFVEKIRKCPLICRDRNDQAFLNLAHSGNAEVLVTSDQDLLVLAQRAHFMIATPDDFRVRVMPN